jgi:hypothetical protein
LGREEGRDKTCRRKKRGRERERRLWNTEKLRDAAKS